ncbi:MAG: T9SS type A sorting domain-containing protein [Bacteroidetes bacterium]|nr:T9SS type A sorting domain-containing protein [Bacteroidota bacterium]
MTLNLLVNPTKSSSFSQTICSNQSYTWNGIAQNTAGAYRDTFPTYLGCDSIVTLNLFVNPVVTSSFSQTICSNQSYLWNGIAQSSAGAYKDTFPSFQNCDSIVTLNLIVNPTKSSSFNQTTCANQPILWNGILRNSSGAYKDTFNTFLGCDSVVTMNLTVTPLPNKATTTSVKTITASQAGATYQWLDCATRIPIAGTSGKGRSFSPTQNGSYNVIVTLNGCSDTSNCVTISGSGIENYAQEKIMVFPNPSHGQIFIQSNTLGTYVITNEIGQKVMTIELNAANKNKYHDIDLSSGVYYIHALDNPQLGYQKMVVTK